LATCSMAGWAGGVPRALQDAQIIRQMVVHTTSGVPPRPPILLLGSFPGPFCHRIATPGPLPGPFCHRIATPGTSRMPRNPPPSHEIWPGGPSRYPRFSELLGYFASGYPGFTDILGNSCQKQGSTRLEVAKLPEKSRKVATFGHFLVTFVHFLVISGHFLVTKPLRNRPEWQKRDQKCQKVTLFSPLWVIAPSTYSALNRQKQQKRSRKAPF